MKLFTENMISMR